MPLGLNFWRWGPMGRTEGRTHTSIPIVFLGPAFCLLSPSHSHLISLSMFVVFLLTNTCQEHIRWERLIAAHVWGCAVHLCKEGLAVGEPDSWESGSRGDGCPSSAGFFLLFLFLFSLGPLVCERCHPHSLLIPLLQKHLAQHIQSCISRLLSMQWRADVWNLLSLMLFYGLDRTPNISYNSSVCQQCLSELWLEECKLSVVNKPIRPVTAAL